jgi:D-3-phosphoglycerate dehydrogenase
MRVLLADKLAPFVAGRLQDLGARVDVDPKLDGDSLVARIRETDPEVLVVRSTKVQKAHLEAGKALSLVIRAGAGVNTIDLASASARGVYVANCPGKNAAAVAELAIGHLVNLDRRIADNVAALRAHRWDKKTFGEARGLRGRTLAVLGVGQIGREVVVRAKAMGMRIVGWDKSLSAAEAEVQGADAVTVHLAYVPETEKRIGASVFGAMKQGSYFVNTSRGEVVDEEALLEACTSKKIRAGLDVFAKEPSASTAEVSGAVFDHPNVYGTHHIGASTDEAEEAVGEETVRIVRAYQAGKPIPNCVNLAHKSGATHVVVVRHVDRVGVLAHVLRILSEAKHNVEDMQNIVFSGNAAACARIDVVGEVSQEVLARIAESPDVFAATVSPIG